MAILKKVLQEKVSIFSDQLYYLFDGFPSNINENAQKWADAIDSFVNSPISEITPPSTSGSIAKENMVSIMMGLIEPVVDSTSFIPFTLYYKSPEYRMRQFNLYLVNKLNYIPNPLLDKTSVFTKLKIIRDQYNRLYPQLAFTTDDIFYNQRRFNEIYLNEINDGLILKLKPDGYTTDTQVIKYQNIPVNPIGKIIKLQEDGIIGDDTIRYLPAIEGSIVQVVNNKNWNQIYQNIPIIVNPKVSGEVDSAIFVKNKEDNYMRKFITNNIVVNDFIKKNKLKDYTKIILDTTQNKIDGGISGQIYSTDQFVNKPISFFINEYERRHTKFDNIWIKNSISSIKELMTFYELKPKIYALKPKNEKDGIKVLERAITSYATQLAIGMAPNFTGAPSATPIDLSTVSEMGLNGDNNSKCINLMVNIIDNYFKSGTAVNNSSGATIFWV